MASRRLRQTVAPIAARPWWALPWWTSLVAAAVAFAALRYGAPWLAGAHPVFARAGRMAPGFAAFPALIFVLLATIGFLRSKRGRARSALAPGLDAVSALSHDELVRLMCDGFRRCGFEPHPLTTSGRVDILLRRGMSRTVVRCRDWRTAEVGAKALSELHAAMLEEGAGGALFVTAGGFSAEAQGFADDKPIGLIGGEALVELVRPGRELPGRVEPYLNGLLVDLRESDQGIEPSPRVGGGTRERVPQL